MTDHVIMTQNIVIMKVNVFEIKAKFSEYLDRVIAGERIVICRHNKPVAELRSVDAARIEERPVGPLPGRPTFEVPPSFFEPLPDHEIGLWDGTFAEGKPSSGSGATRVAEPRVPYGPRHRRTSRKRR